MKDLEKVYCILCETVHHDENGKITFDNTTVYSVCRSEEQANRQIKYYIEYDIKHEIEGVNRYYKILESYLQD